MQSYDTIAEPASAELVEKRSRFLSRLCPVDTEEAFTSFLTEIKTAHRDARHNCWAYILRSGAERYSDDGEPQGTAGVPMLEVLRREKLTDVAVVVTRYFGGILLGAGGLNRAYTQSAKLAVDTAKRVRMRLCALFLLELPYPFYDKVNLLLRDCGAVILATDYAADVTLSVRLERSAVERFEHQLTELSGGQLQVVHTGQEFAAV